ncbi:MAG: hypothetical protein A2751_02235 [Candidatus Doudnabacteria bacterium RIFCSPHIGHO2_01_FULL_46_14]|uniref:Uncharacterized protein n=1 Tax=Candidatus Doudnabacteria bacterium RIFCSPHIGHO2_01_FULL_46_14 TaxID=1817824 RepID=A0A1F5NK09_9BACT|nr:MAG: hypothetical protein A2751_02235 [Candidatus Doudnabacteria bacterium RIFCSPHIGHO2_01_FULL_46_14]
MSENTVVRIVNGKQETVRQSDLNVGDVILNKEGRCLRIVTKQIEFYNLAKGRIQFPGESGYAAVILWGKFAAAFPVSGGPFGDLIKNGKMIIPPLGAMVEAVIFEEVAAE